MAKKRRSVTVTKKNVLDYIMSFESGELPAGKVLKLFSYLIKTRMVNHLQGMYGRTAAQLVRAGWLSKSGKILKRPKTR